MFGIGTAGIAVLIFAIAWLWLLFERPAVAIQIAATIGTVLWKILSAIVIGIARVFGWLFKKFKK